MNSYNVQHIVLLLACMFHLSTFAQEVGDPGWVFDESKYDSRIPAMKEWAQAGVEGGIPYRDANTVKKTLSAIAEDVDMAENISAAINSVANTGGGVVLLKNGIYPLKSKITMRSNVILRGESREGTILESTMTYEGEDEGDRIETIIMNNVTQAGLEDFTICYKVTYEGEIMHPLDYDWKFEDFYPYEKRSQNFENRRVYHDRANFIYHTRNDLGVTFLRITGSSTKNVWIDNCSFLESATDHIFIQEGTHITIRNTRIQGAFQKGGQGNGYGINCYGDHVLMVECTVKKVRHWAIQQGAKYCVVYNCHSEVDMNFHQGDKGLNLIENCKIHIPFHHSWDCYQTGASYHGAPGDANMFYNNDCFQKKDGVLYNDDKIYTFVEKELQVSSLISPKHAALYAIKRLTSQDFQVNGVSLIPSSLILEVGHTRLLTATVSPCTATNKSVTWSSTDPKIATVNDNGLVTAVAEGNAEIKVTTNDGNHSASINIRSVKYDGSMQNLAINKLVLASSNDDNGPANGVDGSTNTRWSAENFPQWLEVDLGELSKISKTELVCYQDRAYQFIVEAKAEHGDSYTKIVDRSQNTAPGSASNPISDIFDETQARFIKLTITGAYDYTGTWASIVEFRVFGKSYNVYTKTNEVPGCAFVMVYPNPFTSRLTINLSEGGFSSLKILDMSGNTVISKKINNERSMELNMTYDDVPVGNYVLQIAGDHKVYSYKLMKQ